MKHWIIAAVLGVLLLAACTPRGEEAVSAPTEPDTAAESSAESSAEESNAEVETAEEEEPEMAESDEAEVAEIEEATEAETSAEEVMEEEDEAASSAASSIDAADGTFPATTFEEATMLRARDYFKGSEDPLVVIIEYGDFQ